jgi:hypothetical protein
MNLNKTYTPQNPKLKEITVIIHIPDNPQPDQKKINSIYDILTHGGKDIA